MIFSFTPLLTAVAMPGGPVPRVEGLTDTQAEDWCIRNLAVNALGHAHPLLVSAVTSQLATLGHVSNLFATPLQVALAERLLDLLGAPDGSAVFFCNSGAEATEAAIKMSRRTGRAGLIAAENGFHGRTLGALALTHKPAYRLPFEPLPGHVVHVPLRQYLLP